MNAFRDRFEQLEVWWKLYRHHFASLFQVISSLYSLALNDYLIDAYSGTTGLCKGVELTHKNIVSNCIQFNSEAGTCLTQPAIGGYQDILPCVLPFFHIYGMTCTMLSKLAHGCKLITLPSFTPDTYLNVLEKYDATVLHLVPPIGKNHLKRSAKTT